MFVVVCISGFEKEYGGQLNQDYLKLACVSKQVLEKMLGGKESLKRFGE